MTKRVFDIIFSSLGLIILSPLFVVIAMLIKTGPKGPVFYKGERIGKHGEIFKMFKFRTMIINKDRVQASAGNDPRITKTGKYLRRFKIDEFPQLINVFKGEMSLVGPRPEIPTRTEIFTPEEKNIILSVRPGLTDPASIWNINEDKTLLGADDPEKVYLEKIRPIKTELQLDYVKTQSFFKDIRIIIDTIFKILKPHNYTNTPHFTGKKKRS